MSILKFKLIRNSRVDISDLTPCFVLAVIFFSFSIANAVQPKKPILNSNLTLEKTSKNFNVAIPGNFTLPYQIEDWIEKFKDPSVSTAIVHFPQIQGLKNKEAEAKINSKIKELLFSDPPMDDRKKLDVYQSYAIAFASPELLSIAIDQVVEFYGAHPDTHSQWINFNLNNGNLLHFYDLLKIENRSEIERLIEQKLRQSLGIEIDLKSRDDFHFTISDKTVVIHFDYYEIGPRPTGQPQVPLHFSEIKNYIKVNGPLNTWLEK